jgi:phosphatidylserine decarboxylase
MGAYLDTEASFTDATYQQFYADPNFRLATGDYEDRALWTNFNRFFSRFLVDPSKRPVAGADDDSIVVAPADSVPQGVWPIDAKTAPQNRSYEWFARVFGVPI